MYRRITEKFTNTEFPEQFGNDLFFCDLIKNRGDSFEYTSNFSIKYVHEGAEFYVIGGKPVKIKPGSYFIVNEGQHVICERPKITRDLAISIFLTQDLVNDVYASFHKSLAESLETPFESLKPGDFYEEIFHYKGDSLGEFLKYLSQNDEETAGIDLNGEEVYYLAAAKLLKTHRKHLKITDRIDKEKPGTREEIFRRINKGKIIIEDCLFEPLTIDFVAKESALSKYQFIRLFSHIFGISPYRYLLKRRIEEAQHILKTQDVSVSEVAEMTGFADVSSFSKRFKKETGVSPSQL